MTAADGCRSVSQAISSTAANRRSPASVKRLTLIATILGSSIVLLDGSVVSVALPSIQRSLGGGLAGQQWVSNAYLLTLGSFILLGGSLGDIFGERRVFALGVAGFGVASVLCAIAPSIQVLIAVRALRGSERGRRGERSRGRSVHSSAASFWAWAPGAGSS